MSLQCASHGVFQQLMENVVQGLGEVWKGGRQMTIEAYLRGMTVLHLTHLSGNKESISNETNNQQYGSKIGLTGKLYL